MELISNKLVTTCFVLLMTVSCTSQTNKPDKTIKTDTIKSTKISYSDYFASPHGIVSYYDYSEGLKTSKNENKPYLVYFTGFASPTSREMEAKVLSDSVILNSIKSEFTMTTLHVDARLVLPSNEWTISDIKGDTIKTYGQKQLDLQMTKFKNEKIPVFYILTSNEAIIAGPYYFDINVTNFRQFLELGKKEFYNSSAK